MPIKTVYVKAKSKKAVNEALAGNAPVPVTQYYLGTSHTFDIRTLSSGDVIKIYEKVVDGNPYAKAYGNWDAQKKRVK